MLGKALLVAAFVTLWSLAVAPLEARAEQAASAQSDTPPTVAATTSPNSASAASRNWLQLHNTHTGETLKITFRTEKGFVPDALEKLNNILADHRSQQHREMDPQLFVLLADLAAAANTDPNYEIISGYRSPETNEKLRTNGGGQAKLSQHIQGKAIDVRLAGVTTDRLRDVAPRARAGRGRVLPEIRLRSRGHGARALLGGLIGDNR